MKYQKEKVKKKKKFPFKIASKNPRNKPNQGGEKYIC